MTLGVFINQRWGLSEGQLATAGTTMPRVSRTRTQTTALDHDEALVATSKGKYVIS